MGGPDPSLSGFLARQGTASALEALAKEEAALLAALLGSEPASSPTVAVADAPPPPRATHRQRDPSEPSLPLVFQPVDPGAVPLSAGQLRALGSIQQWYMDQVGGPNQDPNDPAYRERWLNAQPEVNDMMRGMMGVNAFEEYQLAARVSQQQGQASH